MPTGSTFKLYALVALLAAGCSSGGSKTGDKGETATKAIGPSGGAVASTDGALQVSLPPGALTGDVTISVAPAAAPAAGAVGATYEIGPTGTQFAMPVTMKLSYDGVDLHGAPPSSLRVATYAAGGWQILAGAQVDTQTKTVSGLTTHLSPYAIVTEDAGDVCATVLGPVPRCSGTTGPLTGGDPAPGGSGSGSGSGGGTSAACDVPETCAQATNVCGAYPGATKASCSDSAGGTDGYTAACCFAPATPICFAVENSYTCSGTTNGGGGGQCPTSDVSCATAQNPCRAYPGAAFEGCADTANGYRGSCCFANDAPICVSVGAGCVGSGCVPPRCASANPCGQVTGATVGSCVDTATGFEASCCFAARTLPPPVARPNSGTVDGGTTNPGADAGSMTGGPDGGTGGTDSGLIDPGDPRDGGQPPPPPDGGGTKPDAEPPHDEDGGQPPPPPPDGGGTKPDAEPPHDEDGGQPPPPPPPPPDGGGTKPDAEPPPPPPPPMDGGAAGACEVKVFPSMDGVGACRVQEVCLASGTDYFVRCIPGEAECMCLQMGTPTGSVAGSCAALDANALLAACGYPVP